MDGTIADPDDSVAVRVSTDPAGLAMGLGVPCDPAAAHRANRFFTDGIQAGGAGNAIGLILPLELDGEEVLIADQPGVDVCAQTEAQKAPYHDD